MNSCLRTFLAVASLAISAQVSAEVTFYEFEDFGGQSFSTGRSVGNFERFGFNDRASSVIVTGERWEVCDDRRFRGRCVVLRPGEYPSLASMGLNNRITSVQPIRRTARIDENQYLPLPAAPPRGAAVANIVFFENEGYGGRSFATDERVVSLTSYGFNDRASSVVVLNSRWEVCEDPSFGGRCVVLRPGRYPSLAAMGLNDRVSSVREVQNNARIDNDRYAPQAVPIYDNRRRDNERLFEANVTSVRAVMSTPERRCWVEQEQVTPQNSSANIPGAIAGAVIGGVLGHQVGSGHGKDLATAGGAVAGGLLGSNIGRSETPAQTRDVQRCANSPTATHPDYWDVSYNFRGQEHRIQMTTRPAPTITVNERGEPRG